MNRMHERQLERSIRRALLMKELRESRAAIVAGAFIFLGLPLIWNLILAGMDNKHEFYPGIATALLAGAGWLFCAVLAAQIVCRDFGRRQGDFLLARPVTPAQVIRAKAAAGSGIVVALTLCVFALDGILAAFNGDYKYWDFPWDVLFIVAAACLIMFWLAFAAATITRHTLGGVMLAVLALVFLIALPLVTSSPASGAIAAAGSTLKLMTFGFVWLVDRLPRVAYQSEWPSIQNAASWSGTPASTEWIVRTYPPYLLYLLVSVTIAVLLTGAGWLAAFLYEKRRAVCARNPRRITWFAAVHALIFSLALLFTFVLRDVTPLAAYLVVWVVRWIARRVAARAALSERTLHLDTKSIAWTVGLAMILLFTLAMREVGANMPVTATYWRNARETRSHRGPVQVPCVTTALGRKRIATRLEDDTLTLFEIDNDHISRRFDLIDGFRRDEPHPFMIERAVPLFDNSDRLWMLSMGFSLTLVESKTDSAITAAAPPADRQFVEAAQIRYQRGGPTCVRLRAVDWNTRKLGESIELPRPAELPVDDNAWTVYDAAMDDERVYVSFVVAKDMYSLHIPDSYGNSWNLVATYRLTEGPNATLERVSDPHNINHFVWLSKKHFGKGLDGKVYFMSPWETPLDPVDRSTEAWYQEAVLSFVGNIQGTLPISAELFVGADLSGFYVMETPSGITPRSAPADQAGTSRDPYACKLIGAVRSSPWAWLFRSDRPRLLAAGDRCVWEVHEDYANEYQTRYKFDTPFDPDATRRQGSVFCYDLSDPRHLRRIAHVTTWPILDSFAGPDYLLLDHGPGFSIVRNPK